MLAFVALLIALPVLLAVPEEPQGPFARPIAVVVPVLIVFGLGVASVLGTIFFNQPKFLVPPHLREQDGAAAELWARPAAARAPIALTPA